MGEAFDTKFGGKVTFEEVVYRQMMNIAEASLKIYEYANTGWQKNALNYYYGILTLQSFVEPYIKDEKYKQEIDEIISNGQKQYDILKRNETKDLIRYGRHQYVNLTVSIGAKILKVLMQHLADEALLIPRAIQANADTREEDGIILEPVSGSSTSPEEGVMPRIPSEEDLT
jgi:hypothetical protein